MEYSTHELAQLAGVTARTLRWYDQTGLLRPARTGENGYRYYSEAEVKRLQHILYFRALGVGLAEIKACLDAPDFDRTDMLRSHLAALEKERYRIDRLIASVQETIRVEERKESMSDEKRFEAFKAQAIAENEKKYGAELRTKYGEAEMDAANAAAMKITPEQYSKWQELDAEILRRLEAAVSGGVAPESEEGQQIALLHKRWLTIASHGYDAQRHRGIACLYTADERFTAYYDKNTPGCAAFLKAAIHRWIQ